MLSARAQLLVTVSPAKIQGEKIVIPLLLKNDLEKAVISARAVVFVTDADGKLIGQGARWIIGGTLGKQSLYPAGTNVFNFIVSANQPLRTTNLSVNVSINRLLLQGGQQGNPHLDARVSNLFVP